MRPGIFAGFLAGSARESKLRGERGLHGRVVILVKAIRQRLLQCQHQNQEHHQERKQLLAHATRAHAAIDFVAIVRQPKRHIAEDGFQIVRARQAPTG